MVSAQNPGLEELARSGLEHRIVRFARPRSLEESAAAQSIPIGSVVKTLVVRRSVDDYVLLLVPGDRTIDWPKLRARLGVSRLSLPDADEARSATGYERGAITPFGSHRRWPVIADRRVASLAQASIGAGAHGLVAHLAGADLIRYLDADLADITRENP